MAIIIIWMLGWWSDVFEGDKQYRTSKGQEVKVVMKLKMGKVSSSSSSSSSSSNE